jgi:hypothetical protein
MNVHPRQVREKQIEPVAGIWVCVNCGRRIQVVVDSDVPKEQPFTCVCGATMKPGEEHAQPDEDLQSEVVDD